MEEYGGYIKYYEAMLQSGMLIRYNQDRKNQEIALIYNNIQAGKQNSDYVSMEDRMALSIAAQYVSTLNDHEFIQLLQDTEIINDEQYRSLTRKYKDVDLREEVYIQKSWKAISKAQKEATTDENSNLAEQK